jgi:ribosomal RNA-processing protein 9
MGRWKKIPGGKNGAVVFEVPKTQKAKINGAEDIEENGVTE